MLNYEAIAHEHLEIVRLSRLRERMQRRYLECGNTVPQSPTHTARIMADARPIPVARWGKLLVLFHVGNTISFARRAHFDVLVRNAG